MEKIQYRANKLEIRGKEEDSKTQIEGYFAVFDDETELREDYYEAIDKKAFEGQLEGDVRALYDHDTSKVLGRTKNGTLKLEADDKGLKGVIDINEDDPEAFSLYQKVKRGDVDQCSFGFIPTEVDHEYREDGTVHDLVKACQLIEVSVVAFPAYENTSIAARKKTFEAEKREKTQDFKKRMEEKLYGTKSTDD